MRDPEKTIGNIIDKAKVSFIGSVDGEGFPNMKAMLAPRKRNGIKEFWFTTNTSSMRVAQYRKNPKACIYFYDKRFFCGVMLKGTMKVLNDKKIKKQIWKDKFEMYNKGGMDGGDFILIKFTAENGRYYCNFYSERQRFCEQLHLRHRLGWYKQPGLNPALPEPKDLVGLFL